MDVAPDPVCDSGFLFYWAGRVVIDAVRGGAGVGFTGGPMGACSFRDTLSGRRGGIRGIAAAETEATAPDFFQHGSGTGKRHQCFTT